MYVLTYEVIEHNFSSTVTYSQTVYDSTCRYLTRNQKLMGIQLSPTYKCVSTTV